ncbi:hypothetical protein [Flavobacterium aestivum]|uniref:hypothetical protein n=1 Tax=Flavobacterium aestivum TaxID=3003257 RepID=UPI0022865459|nr:hypothetical protein [Flavobacterium aestivum]
MVTNNIKTKQKLHELVSALYTTFPPDKQKKNLYAVSFTVYDYSHLILIVSDLISLCLSAINDESECGSSSKAKSKVNIAQILNIAIELLPVDEDAFLEKSQEIFSKMSSNVVSEN